MSHGRELSTAKNAAKSIMGTEHIFVERMNESKPVLGFESSLLSQKNGQSYLQTKEFQ